VLNNNDEIALSLIKNKAFIFCDCGNQGSEDVSKLPQVRTENILWALFFWVDMYYQIKGILQFQFTKQSMYILVHLLIMN